MPSIERESQRIVIAGASSLVGAELKTLLEEGQFSGWDLRLVDEEAAAGTLTEAGGEPVVIQPVDEGSFERARFVFFTGSPQFVETNLAAALAAGAVAIDFTGKSSTKRHALLDSFGCCRCRHFALLRAETGWTEETEHYFPSAGLRSGKGGNRRTREPDRSVALPAICREAGFRHPGCLQPVGAIWACEPAEPRCGQQSSS